MEADRSDDQVRRFVPITVTLLGCAALIIVSAAFTLAEFNLANALGLFTSGISLVVLLVTCRYIVRNERCSEAAESFLRAADETLETKVTTRTAQLSHLSQYLLALAESEKAALANELHDELGSNLTALNLDLSSVATRLKTADPALAVRLDRALRLLHETVDLTRRIIHDLRPSMLDSLGLGAAVRMHCQDFTKRSHLSCTVCCPDDFPAMQVSAQIALYRVLQEALTNIDKYARATKIEVVLSASSAGIDLVVSDDGVGIDPHATTNPMSHGLVGMRERMARLGGQFEISLGEAGRGTMLHAFVPHA